MKWPLRKKLYLAFGVLIGMMSLVELVTHLRIQQVEQEQARQMRYAQVTVHQEEMMTALLQARRHEKDFFARQGDEKYEKLVAQRAIEFRERGQAARALLGEGDDGLTRSLLMAEQRYAEYKAAFDRAAALFKRRGTADTGLQAEFRDLAQTVEERARKTNDQPLLIEILQARRAEKDYLLRGDLKYQQTLHGHVDRALTRAESDNSLSDVISPLRDYEKKFDAAVDAGQELLKAQQELHESTESTDSTLAQLHTDVDLTNERVAREIASAQTRMVITSWSVFLLAMIVSLGVARILSGQLSRAVEQLIHGTRRVGEGDLTAQMQVLTNDELGELANSFNGMTKSLRDMTKNVTLATESLGQVIQELQATVSEQGAALQQQASSVSETVATVEEMSRSSGQVSETASQVLAGASRSLDTSNQGKSSIAQSVQGMQDVREQVQNIARTILELSDKTQQIGTIIATVDDFAEQSSLLALNASIEAARAGEDGRAFGVVAGEVKNLAEQSQQATEKVRAILSEIQRATHTAVMVTEEGSKRVDRGVELVNSAGEIIRLLSTNISDSADSAKQIASAARQQSNGVEQINVAISGIEQFARQNLEAIRQTEATTQTLASVSQQLRASSERYVM